jgi:deoxycytidylate deaminase
MKSRDYMKIAIDEAKKSIDPDTQVGCVYVDKSGQVISKGHNSINSFDIVDLNGISRIYKRYLMTHAEVNAIKKISLVPQEGLTAYCTVAPCIECIKLMRIIGVKKVFYRELFASNKTIDMEKTSAINLLTDKTIKLINHSTGISFQNEVNNLI